MEETKDFQCMAKTPNSQDVFANLKYTERKYNIALAGDFFFPRLGGVEMHIYQLGQCLQERGHKVIILTNTYGNRKGVRYLSNGLKVYYTPIMGMFDQVSICTQVCRFPLFRYIFLKEGIDIVHGHQVSALLQYEILGIGKVLGLKTVFTDHSLFNFSDPENIVLHKYSKTWLSEVDAAICVSHVNKENLALRSAINPHRIYVINNAVNTSNFKPDPTLKDPKDKINIVLLSRLTYRKGLDLIVNIIPRICQKYPQVSF